MRQLSLASFCALALAACAQTLPPEEQADLNWARLLKAAQTTHKSGDLTTAAALYETAHAQRPDRLEAILPLADILARINQPLEAEVLYRRALNIDPQLRRAGLGSARLLIARDRPAAALRSLQPFYDQDPKDRDFIANIAVAHDLLGESTRAQAILNRGLEHHPNDLVLLNNLGYSLIRSGDYQKAVAVLRRATIIPGAGAQHRANLALAYGLLGRDDSAAAALAVDLSQRQIDNYLESYRQRRGPAVTTEPLASPTQQAPSEPPAGPSKPPATLAPGPTHTPPTGPYLLY